MVQHYVHVLEISTEYLGFLQMSMDSTDISVECLLIFSNLHYKISSASDRTGKTLNDTNNKYQAKDA